MFNKARLPDFEASFNELDEPIPKCIVDDLFVFMDHDGASRVHDIAPFFAAVNSC